MKEITLKELHEAQEVIFTWFLENNAKSPNKPITILDTDMCIKEHTFRLICVLAFHGRNELPTLESKETKK